LLLCFPQSDLVFEHDQATPGISGLQESSGLIFFFPGQPAFACLSIASTLFAIFMVVSRIASSISCECQGYFSLIG
jgi:hypothetical protein